MVDAGWSYEPLPEADDCVKCFYCGVCLDGWEPKDDPWFVTLENKFDSITTNLWTGLNIKGDRPIVISSH